MSKLTEEQVKDFKEEINDAEECWEYISIAESLAEEGDPQWAKEIYQLAEKHVNDPSEYIEIAQSIMDEDYLDDKKLGRAYCEKALKYIKSIQDYNDLIRMIFDKDYLEDKKWGLELLEKTERTLQTSRDYVTIGRIYARVVGDIDKGRNLFQKAEELAETADDYKHLAGWVDAIFDDNDWESLLRKKAKKVS